LYCKYNKCQDIKAFRNNTIKGVGEGDITADIEFEGKNMRIRLTQVMHIPSTHGKILSLKILARKGFKSHVLMDHIHISKDGKTYMEASLGGQLYKIKMNIIPSKESIMAAVKSDSPTTDLFTWHWRLGHLGDSMLKKLVNSNIVWRS